MIASKRVSNIVLPTTIAAILLTTAIFTTSTFAVQYADAQLIGIEDTTVNIPITLMVPIDLSLQNAQVCASVSTGSQTCNQVVLDPEETAYTPVNVDLSSETPTVTTAEQEPTAATTTEPTTTEPTATTITEPTAPTTTTEPAPAPTEEPTTDTGTQEGGTTTQEPTTDTGTAEPSTEGSTSEGGTQ